MQFVSRADLAVSTIGDNRRELLVLVTRPSNNQVVSGAKVTFYRREYSRDNIGRSRVVATATTDKDGFVSFFF